MRLRQLFIFKISTKVFRPIRQLFIFKIATKVFRPIRRIFNLKIVSKVIHFIGKIVTIPFRLIRRIFNIKIATKPFHLVRRIINKKIIISVFLLLVLIVIIVIGSTNEDDETVPIILTILFIATLGFLVIDRFIQKRKVRELKEASLRAEVDSLKTQINPHFFFNTLNNLYGLTVGKSDKAPEVILKLSDMMRYTIYEGEKDRVAIKDEITYLENFIELQKIRFHREVDVKFEHFLEEDDIMVPPLLFIVLVENAFKHGAESITEDAYIHMKLMSLNGNILFESQNNFEVDESKKPGGIGLKNLQRRLQLLFPDSHTLILDGTGNGIYKAVLKFNIS